MSLKPTTRRAEPLQTRSLFSNASTSCISIIQRSHLLHQHRQHHQSRELRNLETLPRLERHEQHANCRYVRQKPKLVTSSSARILARSASFQQPDPVQKMQRNDHPLAANACAGNVEEISRCCHLQNWQKREIQKAGAQTQRLKKLQQTAAVASQGRF